MSTRRSGFWSMWTFAVLISLLVSAGFMNPAMAQQADDQDIAQQDEEIGRSRSRQTINPALSSTKQDGLVSYREPSERLLYSTARAQSGPNASWNQVQNTAEQLLSEWRQNNYHGPDPDAYQRLLNNEQRALAANSSPQAMGLGVEGNLRLFVVAVEFAGTDTYENFSHAVSVDDTSCVTETVTFEGPLHNQLPQPGPRDNQSYWLPSYEKEYYEKILLSEEGITQRVRPDLIDPEDGQPGIDVSGRTMRNYYNEVSGGRVSFDAGPAGITAWLQVPHSEGYYAANACLPDEEGAGEIQDMDGLPSNPQFPNGVSQLLIDIVDQINAANPSFPWSDYDTNGDGIVDHVIIFHAGADRSDGGGKETYQAIWAHRGNVGDTGYVADDNGTADPSDDIRLNGYAMQDEGAALGVIVHEFGHDLGLPDLYDISGVGESDVVWWDLMSTGSHTGKLFQTDPTHMSAWSKFALGWADTTVVSPTAALQDVTMGQTSRPPAGTEQAVRVNLPNTEIRYLDLLEGSTLAWWTGNDQDWADARLTHDFNLAGQTGTISMSFDIDYIIEEDWDYLFVEVSADGGQTWTQTKGYLVGTGEEVTTPDNYGDPNGRLADYGGLKYGYTGDSGGWIRVYHNLSPYAGQQIKVRFRYATDAAFLERGAFVDNIAVTSGSTTIFTDPVEDQDGWTPELTTFVNEPVIGQGWRLNNGVEFKPLYYLLEWRNFDGFDRGLRYTYNTVFFIDGTEDRPPEWRVDKIPSNIPGMLVWLRDTRYGNDPFGANNQIYSHILDSPSEGAKGGLLVVDANSNPLRGPLQSTVDFGFGEVPYPPEDNWSGRVQTTNAAFSLQNTPGITLTIATNVLTPATTVYTPTHYVPMPAVTGFHDSYGYYPGVEALPEPVITFANETLQRIKPYALSDPDASVVIPAKSYYPPRTPEGFTGRGAETSPPSVNVSTFETLYLGDGFASVLSVGEAGETDVTGQHSGNPGSTNIHYGYHFEIIRQADDGSTGTIRLYNKPFTAKINGTVETASATAPVSVTVGLQNIGGKGPYALYSDFDETQATYVQGSATNGAVPVSASPTQVQRALNSRGVEGVRQLAVDASTATAIVLISEVDTSETIGFSYALNRKPGVNAVKVMNTAFGPSVVEQSSSQFGTFLYLPAVNNGQSATR